MELFCLEVNSSTTKMNAKFVTQTSRSFVGSARATLGRSSKLAYCDAMP